MGAHGPPLTVSRYSGRLVSLHMGHMATHGSDAPEPPKNVLLLHVMSTALQNVLLFCVNLVSLGIEGQGAGRTRGRVHRRRRLAKG